MSHSLHPPAEEFNELDPHGFEKPGHGQHEHHAVIGPFTLRTILAFLLLFTALTVGLAQAEIAIAHALDIELPWWVNVAVAMSIAVVKSLLVMAFFMQLKYDNPLNSVLMCFTFFALFLFLFFTGLDLFSRDRVYDYKAGPVVAGGTGSGVTTANGQPIVKASREKYMAEWGPEKFAALELSIKHHGHAPHHEEEKSDASRSRPRTGTTDALGAAAQGHHDDHSGADKAGGAAGH